MEIETSVVLLKNNTLTPLEFCGSGPWFLRINYEYGLGLWIADHRQVDFD